MILYAAGETLGGGCVDKIPEQLQFEQEKLQLKHICREAIRKHLLKLDPHQHLFGRIPRLGLPNALKKYLLYNQSLDGDDNSDDNDDDDTDTAATDGDSDSDTDTDDSDSDDKDSDDDDSDNGRQK